MCGICGIVGSEPASLGSVIRSMNDAQAHRGPDGEGYYVAARPARHTMAYDVSLDAPSACALGHRRLAILDPRGGAQPMAAADGRIVVLLNGEIYNFREIRSRLEQQGCRFRTDSDTEVLIHLYLEQPDDPASWLNTLNGIFSLAVWDQGRGRLLLARDPYGVKPLHYVTEQDRFLFASEIKALLAAGVKPRLNRAALHVFMNVRYVPGEQTLFESVYRLPPAHYAIVSQGRLVEMRKYYELPTAPAEDARVPRDGIEEKIRTRFHEAVERQLLSDVPLGMALSGGLDSSMIVAAAARSYAESSTLRTADRVLRTFTLGFNEPTDENDDARIVAERFSSEHHDMLLDADPLKEAREVIRAVEEPKINMLQGYALARFVGQHVKVLFSGLGGDELFAGYDIHRFCNTLGRLHRAAPAGLQRRLLGPIGSALWRAQARSGALKREVYRIGGQIALSLGDRTQFYCRLRNAWDDDAGMYARLYAHPDAFRDVPVTATYFVDRFQDGTSFLEQVLRAEFQTKMVDDFLVNEDRVTSAHGVEGRVPFLDRDLVEFAFRIPARWKMAGWQTKSLWKRSVGVALPGPILKKKKHGFTFSSYQQWQKDLRAAVEKNLTVEWCHDTGLFNHAFIEDVLSYPAHPNLRWHYFVAWMMLGVKEWMEIFDVQP